MYDIVGNRVNSTIRFLVLSASLAMLLPVTACNSNSKSSEVAAGPRTFASPQDAGKALLDAVKSQDQTTIQQIFGPGSQDVLSSGDAVEDKSAMSRFVLGYEVMNRWRKIDSNTQMLLVGAENRAFPVPLMKNAAGQWYFDIAAGKDEILSRRIGRNELTAIDVEESVADAQAQFYSQSHGGSKQYAQKFLSDAGQQNGLYWDSPEGSPRSPLGPMVAFATAEGYKLQPNKHEPFNGYYYHMLDKQGPDAKGGAKSYIVNGKMTGGFAVVAYPAQYGDSGIMTFMINQNRVMFQKDLGKTTDAVASAMTEFNPDKTWTVVE
jgi:hypothetical protein